MKMINMKDVRWVCRLDKHTNHEYFIIFDAADIKDVGMCLKTVLHRENIPDNFQNRIFNALFRIKQHENDGELIFICKNFDIYVYPDIQGVKMSDTRKIDDIINDIDSIINTALGILDRDNQNSLLCKKNSEDSENSDKGHIYKGHIIIDGKQFNIEDVNVNLKYPYSFTIKNVGSNTTDFSYRLHTQNSTIDYKAYDFITGTRSKVKN